MPSFTDIDADGYPSDSTYINTIGDTVAWDTWNTGKWRWSRIKRHFHNGVWRRNMGIDTPISGGYGEDKHTLVAEFPPHLLIRAMKERELKVAAAKKSNEDAARMLGHGSLGPK